MYPILLTTHSLFRWLVLAGIVYTLFRSYYGWLGKKTFTAADNKLRIITTSIIHLQFIFGLVLYFISPVTDYFLKHFSTAVHDRQTRFFGMEHSLMMVVAVILITIGSIKAKYKTADTQKFKTLAIWFTIGLIIILTNIP